MVFVQFLSLPKESFRERRLDDPSSLRDTSPWEGKRFSWGEDEQILSILPNNIINIMLLNNIML
jgi:hypothetical protein